MQLDLLSALPWTRYSAGLGLSFPTCKPGIITVILCVALVGARCALDAVILMVVVHQDVFYTPQSRLLPAICALCPSDSRAGGQARVGSKLSAWGLDLACLVVKMWVLLLLFCFLNASCGKREQLISWSSLAFLCLESRFPPTPSPVL